MEFPKKYLKLLGDFPEKAGLMSVDDLKKELIKYEQTISATERDRDEDVKLQSLKEEVKEASEPYNSLIKESFAAVKYIVYELESRGQSTDKKE